MGVAVLRQGADKLMKDLPSFGGCPVVEQIEADSHAQRLIAREIGVKRHELANEFVAAAGFRQ